MSTCPHCDSEIVDSATKCPECGKYTSRWVPFLVFLFAGGVLAFGGLLWTPLLIGAVLCILLAFGVIVGAFVNE